MISLLSNKFFNLIFIGVVAAAILATIVTISIVVDSPTDPTAPQDITTPDDNGSGSTDDTTVSDDGSGSDIETTTPDGGSGSGDSDVDSSIILKIFNSQPIILEHENEEDLISEGFMRLN